MSFAHRPRRARRTAALRDLFAETDLGARHLVMPHFVLPDEQGDEPIAAMPGVTRQGREVLLRRVEADLALGLRTVLLFGICAPEHKTTDGASSRDETGAAPRAIAALKRAFGNDLTVMSDVCLCGYTDHGHCGVLGEHGDVANDETLPLLAEMACVHAQAGADVVAPSDMMDGRVAAIRTALDAQGHAQTAILSYAVKYASAYYGPFRDAAGSAPGTGDRKAYQMDVRNVREAQREALLDEQEGADALMVKPALAFLDVIARVRQTSSLPLFAYNVSGEYAMVHAAAARGWIDEAAVVRENLLAMRRAGADAIITYHARHALKGGWL